MPCSCPTCEARKVFHLYLVEELKAPEIEAAMTLASLDNAVIHSVPLPMYQQMLKQFATKAARDISIMAMVDPLTTRVGFKFPKPFEAWVKAKTK